MTVNCIVCLPVSTFFLIGTFLHDFAQSPVIKKTAQLKLNLCCCNLWILTTFFSSLIWTVCASIITTLYSSLPGGTLFYPAPRCDELHPEVGCLSWHWCDLPGERSDGLSWIFPLCKGWGTLENHLPEVSHQSRMDDQEWLASIVHIYWSSFHLITC